MAYTSRNLKFAGGSTNIITGAFNVYGESGALMTLGSTNTTPAILQSNIGIPQFLDYLNISYITFLGNGWLRTVNSNDNGNNTNLVFMQNAQLFIASLNQWKTAKIIQLKLNGVWTIITKAQVKISGVWESIY
jgi:hypothetical protein